MQRCWLPACLIVGHRRGSPVRDVALFGVIGNNWQEVKCERTEMAELIACCKSYREKSALCIGMRDKWDMDAISPKTEQASSFSKPNKQQPKFAWLKLIEGVLQMWICCARYARLCFLNKKALPTIASCAEMIKSFLELSYVKREAV